MTFNRTFIIPQHAGAENEPDPHYLYQYSHPATGILVTVGEPLVETVDRILERLGHKVFDVNPVEPPDSDDKTLTWRNLALRIPPSQLDTEVTLYSSYEEEYYKAELWFCGDGVLDDKHPFLRSQITE